jgi:hypothetical protein
VRDGRRALYVHPSKNFEKFGHINAKKEEPLDCLTTTNTTSKEFENYCVFMD